MKIKVGDKVCLIDNHAMAAEIGAVAIVDEHEYNCVVVRWICEKGTGQLNGHYISERFEPELIYNSPLCKALR